MGNHIRYAYYKYQRIKVERVQLREKEEDAAFDEMKQTKKRQRAILKEQKAIIQKKLDSVRTRIDVIVEDPNLDDQDKIAKLGGHTNTERSYQQELESIELCIIQCNATLATIRSFRRSVQNQRTNKKFVEISSRVPHLDLEKRVQEMERTNDDAQDVIDRLQDINQEAEMGRVDPFEVKTAAKDKLEQRRKHLSAFKSSSSSPPTVEKKSHSSPPPKQLQPLLSPPPEPVQSKPPRTRRDDVPSLQQQRPRRTIVDITDEELDTGIVVRHPTQQQQQQRVKAAASAARATPVVVVAATAAASKTTTKAVSVDTTPVKKKTVSIVVAGECNATTATPKTLEDNSDTTTSVRLLA
jgi:hypothetical protein